MTTVYSERRGANVEVLVQQWHDALQQFDVAQIDAAWKKCRTEEKFFPSIATFMEHVRASFKPAPRNPFPNEEPAEPFCQDGRTVEEEIAYRAAVCLRLRMKHGFRSSNEIEEAPREPVPAAQGGPTSALIALAKQRGYYRGADDEEQVA